MKSYLELVENVLNNGEIKENRTGINTISTTGAMIKCDLRDGFPIITTRKQPIKSTLTELEFFIKGITDKKWLQDRKCKFWDDWANPEKVPYANDEDTKTKMRNETDLGEVYGYIWNNWECNNIIKIQPPDVTNIQKTTIYPLFKLIAPEIKDDPYIGTVYKNTIGNEYTIISKGNRDDDRNSYNIQFKYTGYVYNNVRIDVIKNGNIKDPYYPSVCGVGYLGVCDPITSVYGSHVYNNLYKIWNHMLHRCYNPKCKEYKLYGAVGVFVDSRWHSFELFLTDVTKLPGWVSKLRYLTDFEIDKDYYGSNVYSKYTSVWLSHKDNILYRTSNAFYIIDRNSNKNLYISQSKCASDYGLQSTKISSVLNGKRPHHKGYTFKYVNDNCIYRYQLPINQLKRVIDTLKVNPFDRRLIVNAWNPSVLHKQALPPCHYVYELISDGTHLDLIFNMRSSDVGLGLPANLASYAMLLMLIAEEVNMTPRHLVYFGGDVHIYENHIDQLKIQLQREPYKLPTMKIKKRYDVDGNWSIYDWNSQTDWELIDYNSHDVIKMPVAV